MSNVIPILQARRFSLSEAEALLPTLKKITQKALQEFLILEEKLKGNAEDQEKCQKIEKEIAELLNRWGQKVLKLGCLPKGIWLVDFDNGKGYYCWRYGEEKIEYFHHYHENYSQRSPLTQISQALLS